MSIQVGKQNTTEMKIESETREAELSEASGGKLKCAHRTAVSALLSDFSTNQKRAAEFCRNFTPAIHGVYKYLYKLALG